MSLLYKITCDICHKNGKLYLYVRDPLIFSLCKRCISTQLELERYVKTKKAEANWKALLEAIADGTITKDNIQDMIDRGDI